MAWRDAMEIQATAGNATARRLPARDALLLLGVAVLLGIIGFLTVHHRADFSSNSAFYLAMAEHGTNSVPPPFRYRALVPFVARLLPMTADHAFVLISNVSLVGCLFLAMLISSEVGLSIPASLFGAIAVFSSRAITYNYLNPYMTDGVELLALFIMIYAYLREKSAAFG